MLCLSMWPTLIKFLFLRNARGAQRFVDVFLFFLIVRDWLGRHVEAVDHKFHDSWINSYILLTLPHTIMFFSYWEKQVVDQTFHDSSNIASYNLFILGETSC